VIEDILDRQEACQIILRQIDAGDENSAKRLVFWLLQAQPGSDEVVETGTLKIEINEERIIKLSKMLDGGLLNSNAAQVIFNEMLTSSKKPEEIAKEKNLIQVSDKTEIEKIVAEVLEQNPKAAQDVKNGEMKAVGFLVGQVMAKSQGNANPQLAQQIIKRQLNIQ
jgi:aspartyl-tRNA(Asn)/glutamyl-tRNA(Gln) amidotransferase subunit B